jgi:hypothetical protein
MKNLLRPLLVLLILTSLTALGAAPLVAQTTLDDPQLDIGNPSTCPAPTVMPGGCPFIFGGTEVFAVPSTGVTIYNNGASSSATAEPILLIVGIPNPTASTTPPTGISVGKGTSGLTGLSGQLGGPNAWGGSWNTLTGAVAGGPFTSGKVYSIIGLNGSSSEQIGSGQNWNNADKAVLGLTVKNWDLFVYSITFPAKESLDKGTYITISFTGGTLPVGTFVIASGCAPGNDVTMQCKGNALGTTPFTTSGLVTTGQTPEPASMLLVGSGLVAFGGMLRRRKAARA